MRTLFTAALAILSIFGLTANAQSTKVKADIPFNFIVAGQHMDGGTYTVERLFYGDNALMLKNDTTGKAIGILANSAYSTSNQGAVAKMVFDRYGDKYFLSEIWRAGGVGCQVRKPKEARDLERHTAPKQVAVLLYRQ